MKDSSFRSFFLHRDNISQYSNELDLLDYPLEIKYANRNDCHLVSSRDIRRGDVILKECPLSLAIIDEFSATYCSICAQKLTFNSNGVASLCEECSSNNYLKDLVRFFQENMIIIKSDSEKGLYQLFFRLFLSYSIRRSNFLDDDVLIVPLESIGLLAFDYLGIGTELEKDILVIGRVIHSLFPEVSQDLIRNVMKVVVCNQHAIQNEQGFDIGRCICPIAALFNHSCEPNVHWICSSESKGIMTCVAALDIPKGTPLTISYINPEKLKLLASKERSEVILRDLNFYCSCTLCSRNCNSCFHQSVKLSYCSRCKCSRYCSRECQKEDWERHRLFCGLLFKGKHSI